MYFERTISFLVIGKDREKASQPELLSLSIMLINGINTVKLEKIKMSYLFSKYHIAVKKSIKKVQDIKPKTVFLKSFFITDFITFTPLSYG